jgi:hypothetical protein
MDSPKIVRGAKRFFVTNRRDVDGANHRRRAISEAILGTATQHEEEHSSSWLINS